MEENKTSTWEEYRKRTHVIGRVVSAVTLVMLVGAPFLMGKILGAYPDLGAVARAFLSVGLVWLVSSVAEFLIYTPMPVSYTHLRAHETDSYLVCRLLLEKKKTKKKKKNR